jgi:CDP-diglyceride synthetase
VTNRADARAPSTTEPSAPVPESGTVAVDTRARTARLVFQGALCFTIGITLLWAVLLWLGPERTPLFGKSRFDRETLPRVAVGFLIMSVIWGWLWYRIRALLLRRVVGLSEEEVREVFTSRMNASFEVARYVPKYSERRIRITDMIGRRGRFITIAVMGFMYIYSRVAVDPKPEYLMFGAWENLFDAVAFSWLNLAAYYSDGFFGRVVFGAQTRIMDGALGRANCLLITTLWFGFKFIMLPIATQLVVYFPPETYAPLFAFIWMSYVACDATAEVAGSMFGRQKLRVWGIGDVNRKSVEGTVAGFLGSLALCLAIVASRGLPPSWIALAVVVSLSNTLLELYSPRGTDDITMATGNALLCWGFGALVY